MTLTLQNENPCNRFCAAKSPKFMQNGLFPSSNPFINPLNNKKIPEHDPMLSSRKHAFLKAQDLAGNIRAVTHKLQSLFTVDTP